MSAEVLVVGAGMVGVGTALALQQRGARVMLVDRRPPGRETSYGNAGLIQREAVRPYAFPRRWGALLKVAARRGNDVHFHLAALPALAPSLWRYWRHSAPQRYARLARDYSRLIEHCIAEHDALIRQAGAQDLVRQDGWLQAFRGAALLEAEARAATALAGEHGLRCEVLDRRALRQAEPGLRPGLAGAIHWQDPWAVSDPGELVERYADLFTRQGGRLCVADAASLRQTAAGWAIDTGDGPVEAAQAVLALGPWAAQATRRLGYRLPLFVKRGYHRHYGGQPQLARPLLDTESGIVLAPMKRGLRLTTGAEFAALDARATPVQLARAEHLAGDLVDLGPPVEAAPWLGARPCTIDMKPVIGPAPRHRGLWFNFGHAHQGFTLGPASGRLLAEMLLGERPYIDPAPYLATRFRA